MREDWTECCFEGLLDYEQPTKYIVKSTKYSDSYKMPVLTAGKSFIKGYTNETDGIFENLPTIIFDDFTTATQYVNFKFKVKSSAMKILVPTSKSVNMPLAFYAMQVNQVRSDTHKRYWISVFSKKKFLLPPLVEQNAIVKKIEELFTSLDSGIADLKKAQDQLVIYRQAVLKKAFEGKLTKEWREKQTNLTSADELHNQIEIGRQNFFNKQIEEWELEFKNWEENGENGKKPKKPRPLTVPDKPNNGHNERKWEIPNNWIWTQIGTLCFVTKLAGFEYTDYVNYNENGDLPVLKAENAGPNGFKKTDFSKVKSESVKMLTRSRIFGGELLVVFVGAGTGNVAMVPFNQRYFLGPNIGMARPYFDLNSKFLELFLQSAFGKSLMMSAVKAVAQPSLSMGTIRQAPIAFPSLKEQHQIVLEIESRLSVCDKVEESITVSLEKAQALRQSILKKAFEGTLLSAAEIEQCKQHKDYEPASVLLEKIKAEKLAIERTTKKSKPRKKKTIKQKPPAPQKISTDIQAGVIAKVIQLHENNPKHLAHLTHVKCEKISHLVEYHLQIPLGRVPVKDAAGPDDYNHLKKVEHRAGMAGYFKVVKKEIGHTYAASRNIAKAIDNLESRVTAEQKRQLDDLINLFLKFDLERAEIIATLYAGWNNLLIDGKTPTDDEIVYESRENWSKRKLTIKRERFYKALQWMRKDEIGLVPIGFGTKVLKPIKQK